MVQPHAYSAVAMEPAVNGTDTSPQVRAADQASPPWVRDFRDVSRWWRNAFSEVLGTFLLVLGGVGSSVVMAVSGVPISRAAAVIVPGLTVMAVILFMGKVGGAHLNPVVSIAFALRREFPWARVPGYIASQLVGGLLACLFLWAVFGRPGTFGATVPAPSVSDLQALLIEVVLTMGLVSVILGTASSAQNVGGLSALAVGGYIALAGLWSSPISGASMNPVRTFAPDLVRGDLTHTWLYLVGPLLGSLLAVAFAFILRGSGRDPGAMAAAQGDDSERHG
jgi:aquaporin Z